MNNSSNNKTFVIGADLGGTNLQAVVVDESNSIIGHKHARTESDQGKDHVTNKLVETINGACAAAGISLAEIGAVGVAAAGAMDIPNGVVLEAPNLGWTNFAFRDRLEQALNRPVVLENDVNGATWGEYCLGAGFGRGDMLSVWVGTGIGGGLILNGKIHHGEFFTAGEIGHTILTPNGKKGNRTVEDHCGRRSIIRSLTSQLASNPNSMLHELTEGLKQKIDMNMLCKAYSKGDSLTQSVINRSAELLGIAISNWVTMLAMDTVIVGGGITESLGQAYLDRIIAAFKADVFPPRCKECRIVATELKGNAGLLGAALLAHELVNNEQARR